MPGGHHVAGRKHGGDVGAERQDRDPADGKLAGEADHQIEPGGQNPVDAGADRDDAPVAAGEPRQREADDEQHQKGEGGCECARVEQGLAARPRLCGGYLRHTRRPSRCACKPLRPEQQHDDEHGEHRNGREDAADEEVGGLLEQAEDQPRNDGAADVAHAAERDRNEAVEGQHRCVGEEGEQQLAAGETRERADRAGEREARDAQVAVRQAERARRIVVLGDRQKGVADKRVAVEDLQPDDRPPTHAIIGSQNC